MLAHPPEPDVSMALDGNALSSISATLDELVKRLGGLALEADVDDEALIELREVEVRSETMAAHVLEELSIDLVRIYPEYTHEDQDWGAIKSEIDELRRKIDRLGSVNLDAISELEELTPRHEHLVESAPFRAKAWQAIDRFLTANNLPAGS